MIDPSDRPLRIACHSIYLPSESKIGSGHQAHGLANALADLGHDVTMFSPCRAVDGARYRHVHMSVQPPARLVKWAWMARSIDWSEFDALISHGEDYLVRAKHLVHIRTMHGSAFSEARRIHGAKERLRMAFLGVTEVAASWRADATVAVSKNTTRSFPWIKTVIPCGVDVTRFQPGSERAENPTVLFVGTYEQRKRGRSLMETFEREVRPVVPNADLKMVCSDAPSAPGVEVLGRVDDDRLAELFREAWVFCLPSSYEGFGVPYIEAMASGTPIVATPNPGAVEVLDDGRLGRIVDLTGLGAALVEALGSPPLSRLDLVEAARAYAWPAVAGRYVELIRAIAVGG